LKGKEIKRATLNELVDYISAGRGVLSEPTYPEIIRMVWIHYSILFLTIISQSFTEFQTKF
jgi:serine/threonine-protein phosphatase 2A regulatory subunit B'